MTAPLRRAGWGTLDDGSVITWTISTGRRGRRWREVVATGGAVRHSLLLETEPDGRFSHLELASAGGLWTFHPEGGGTLHGNHVDPAGARVRHTEGWRFGADDVLLVMGSVIGAAAVAWHLAATVAPGQAIDRHGVRLDPAGTLDRDDAIHIARLTATRWRLGGGPVVDVDDEGVPRFLQGGTAPLEVH